MKARQIRLRTCIGCGTVRIQSQMVRFVRNLRGSVIENEGEIRLGRGAYLCEVSKESCLVKAIQRRSFDRALPVI